jgi:hypothetical protein
MLFISARCVHMDTHTPEQMHHYYYHETKALEAIRPRAININLRSETLFLSMS